MSEDKDVQAEDEKQQVEETTEEQTDVTDEVPSDDDKAEEPSEETVEDDDDSEPEERTVYTMPVAKAQKEKERAVEKAREEAREEARKEMQEELDKLRSQTQGQEATSKQQSDYEDKLAEVAEKHGLKKDAAKDLLDAFKSSIELPDLSKYDKLIKEQEIETEKQKVSKTFDEKVVPLIKKDYPNATPQHIAEVKARIEELAFSKGYNTYRVEDIYRVKSSDFKFKSGHTAEKAGGHASELVDFSKMTDEEEIKLADSDPEKYREYIKWRESQDSPWSRAE